MSGKSPDRRLFRRSLKTYGAYLANDRGIGHGFWVFHGVNYLADFPFRGIYHGDTVYRGAIFSHILSHHMVDGALTPIGRQCLVWASAQPRELYRATVYVKTFAKKYGCNPYEPDSPYLEVAILAMARVMTDCTRGWGVTKPPSPTDYYRDPKEYTKDLNRAMKTVLACDPRTRDGWEFWADLHRQTIAKYGLPPGVKPFRLEYRERKNGGYLLGTGDLRGYKTKDRIWSPTHR